MRAWLAGVWEDAGEAFVVMLCYLVLCACGWAVDHLLLSSPGEPAP